MSSLIILQTHHIRYIGKFEHYQICYPSNDSRWISVVEGFATIGNSSDRLEIMGGFTPLEDWEIFTHGTSSVKGWLTAKNVFRRIENHYKNGGNM